MSQDARAETFSSLIDRVKSILLSPKETWLKIDLEPYELPKLLRNYILILAAIGPVCSTLGLAVFGIGVLGIVYHPSVLTLMIDGVATYVLAVVGVFVLGFIINALAPNFGGTKDQGQAMKTAAYSLTAAWVAGVFSLLPQLAALGILGGLYTLYLLYLGLPALMKAPQDKAVGYAAVVVLVGIVIGVVLSAILLPLHALTDFGGSRLGAIGAAAGSAGVLEAAGSKVDLGKLQAASSQVQAQTQAIASGVAAAPTAASGPALTTDQLKTLLPSDINGYVRGDTTTESVGAGGVGASHARADYVQGQGRFTLEISDLAAMGALGSMAAAMNVNSDKDTGTGYERVTTANGRVTTENYDRTAKSGKFGVLVAGRISVEATGTGVPIDDLKAAVNAVGLDRLDAMAHHG